jgi:hypothetical protein
MAGDNKKKKKGTSSTQSSDNPSATSEPSVGGGSSSRGEDLTAAMSACAGCKKPIDHANEKKAKHMECPNCKLGESAGRKRHFYCSKKCFTSSWKKHKKLHVRVGLVTMLLLCVVRQNTINR